MKLSELHSPPEKQDLQKLKAYLLKPLKLKKLEMHHFDEAQHDAKHVLSWATSMTKGARLDLSNVDAELESLIMRFTLAWYKFIVEHAEGSKKRFQDDLYSIKIWIRDLKYSKFPAAEIDVLYKSMLKPRKKNETP